MNLYITLYFEDNRTLVYQSTTNLSDVNCEACLKALENGPSQREMLSYIRFHLKASNRIRSLYAAVQALAQETSDSVSMREAIMTLVFADLDGNHDSVFSAIMQDKYGSETIANIGLLGLRFYRELLAKRNVEKYRT